MQKCAILSIGMPNRYLGASGKSLKLLKHKNPTVSMYSIIRMREMSALVEVSSFFFIYRACMS